MKSSILLRLSLYPPTIIFFGSLFRFLSKCGYSAQIHPIIIYVFATTIVMSLLIYIKISVEARLPYIFNFSFFQKFLYSFLISENIKNMNIFLAAGWGFVLTTIPCYILLVLLVPLGCDPVDVLICSLMFLVFVYVFLSYLVAYFINPQLEGFQFLAENQKLEEITWENFFRSMSYVSMHYYKNPIQNHIDPSWSKVVLSSIAKTCLFKMALTNSGLFAREGLGVFFNVFKIMLSTILVGQFYAADRAGFLSSEIAKITAESQVRVAEINLASQERIAKIRAEAIRIEKEEITPQEKIQQLEELQKSFDIDNIRTDLSKTMSPEPQQTTAESNSKISVGNDDNNLFDSGTDNFGPTSFQQFLTTIYDFLISFF